MWYRPRSRVADILRLMIFRFLCPLFTPLGTGRKLNVHRTFSTSSERLIYVQIYIMCPGENFSKPNDLNISAQSSRETFQLSFTSLKSTMETSTIERRHWRCSGVFVVNFEHISYIVSIFPLLTLSK